LGPESVGACGSQVEHQLSVLFLPCSWNFEAGLDEVAVRAFNFPGADGQALLTGLGVVELVASFAQITVSFGHGAFSSSGRLQSTGQILKNQACFVFQQKALLLLEPGLDVFERRRGRGQILADMVEVHQVGRLGAEMLLHLGNDPRSPVAQGVHARALVEPGALSHFAPKLAGHFRAGQSRAKKRRGRVAIAGQAGSDFAPLHRAGFAPITRGLGRPERWNHAAVDLRDQHKTRRALDGLQGADLARVPVRLDPRTPGSHPHTVMLQGSRRRLGKRSFGPKINQDPAQGARTTARLHAMALAKGSPERTAPLQPPDLLLDLDMAEDGLPAEFFLACLTAPDFWLDTFCDALTSAC